MTHANNHRLQGGILLINLYNTCSGRKRTTECPAASEAEADLLYRTFQPPAGWEKYGYSYERNILNLALAAR